MKSKRQCETCEGRKAEGLGGNQQRFRQGDRGRQTFGANQERMTASIPPHVEREIPGEGWLHQEKVGSRGE